jgi:hypothetical protein
MSTAGAFAAVLIPLAIAGTGVLALCLAGRCDHTLHPTLHEGAAKVFYVCRCGERFER